MLHAARQGPPHTDLGELHHSLPQAQIAALVMHHMGLGELRPGSPQVLIGAHVTHHTDWGKVSHSLPQGLSTVLKVECTALNRVAATVNVNGRAEAG